MAIIAALVVAANADTSSNITGAAKFMIEAQEILNRVDRENYEEAVRCANLSSSELQRGAVAIDKFQADLFALTQSIKKRSFRNQTLPDATVIKHVEGSLAVVQDRMGRFDFGSQIIAAIVNLNNEIGVRASTEIAIFYTYLQQDGSAAHCFTEEIPRINDDASKLVASVKAALKKLIDEKSAEVDAWIGIFRETMAGLKKGDSLSEIETTVTTLVAQGLSSSFWSKHITDLKDATKTIVNDADSRLKQIKKDIEECAL